MKQLIKRIAFVFLATAAMAPVSLLAQNGKNDKEDKEKKEVEQIIITRKGDKNEKMVIELNGDKVIVNGKAVDDDNDGDVTVHRNKIKDVWAFGNGQLGGVWNDNFALLGAAENRALLGVTTEKDDKGAEIKTVTKESSAEKAGLKKGDIITKIDDKKIENPDDLSAAIREHKPGDKVSVSYLRDAKEQKVTAELGKWQGMRSYAPGQNYHLNMPDMNFDIPRIQTYPRINGQAWNWSAGAPRLGLSVQDTEDGKGVKVIEVDEDGNAEKAGIREEDVITEVDGKAVNSADEVAKLIRENKDKVSVKVKLLRQGKTETIDVKIPRKLKTADL
jgi:serine protease Do